MAQKKKPGGLGRGLDALLGDYDVNAPAMSAGIQELALESIHPNVNQPRKDFDETRLEELAGSLRLHGMVQPIVVRPDGDHAYMIITGERRFRAAQRAGLLKVPVVIRAYEDEQIHEIALIENIQREDLNPIEEAAAIAFLMQQHDLTQEEVAARLSKSRPAIANTLRLLSLPEKVKAYLRAGSLSSGHGRALASLEDAQLQERLARQAVENGYSVRAMEQVVRAAAGQGRQKPARTSHKAAMRTVVDNDITYVEEKLRERLCTKVKIQGGKRRGKIVIEYYSPEMLQDVYDMLLGKKEG